MATHGSPVVLAMILVVVVVVDGDACVARGIRNLGGSKLPIRTDAALAIDDAHVVVHQGHCSVDGVFHLKRCGGERFLTVSHLHGYSPTGSRLELLGPLLAWRECMHGAGLRRVDLEESVRVAAALEGQ